MLFSADSSAERRAELVALSRRTGRSRFTLLLLSSPRSRSSPSTSAASGVVDSAARRRRSTPCSARCASASSGSSTRSVTPGTASSTTTTSRRRTSGSGPSSTTLEAERSQRQTPSSSARSCSNSSGPRLRGRHRRRSRPASCRARSSNFEHTIEIDKGRATGIKVGMPVVTGAGLVGQHRARCTEQRSVVRLLTDPTFAVGVSRVDVADDDGIVHGHGAGQSAHARPDRRAEQGGRAAKRRDHERRSRDSRLPAGHPGRAPCARSAIRAGALQLDITVDAAGRPRPSRLREGPALGADRLMMRAVRATRPR